MSLQETDFAIAERAAPPAARGDARSGAGALRRAVLALRADPERMLALRESARALLTSRLLVLSTGVAAAAAFGLGSARNAYDPPGLTSGFGRVGDLLAAPVARWDAAWYLAIAHWGYQPSLGAASAPRTAYFPLYPLAMRALSVTGLPLIVAGVLISLCAFGLALYGLHRLALVELRRPGALRPSASPAAAARLAVLAAAFSPMALFFSAVFTDALYMALSIGVFASARRGRWAAAGALGGFAAATRSTGLVLVVPAAVMYLYGPRTDRAPEREGAQGARGRAAALASALRPRYRLRADVLWLALVPAGIAAYAVGLWLAGGDGLGPFHAEQSWYRHFAGPFGGVWTGLVAGWDGLRQLLSMQTHHVYFKLAGGDPMIAAQHNLTELAFLLAALPALVGIFRRLPFAYGAYVLAAMALPLSYPVSPQPLMSVPRYLVVLFPLSIWAGAWLAERPRLTPVALVGSVALLVFFTGQFSTWHWVA
jgi:hypothetical protein